MILFRLFMLFVGILFPCLMVGIGKWYTKHPPQRINPNFGYRTTRSMKNQDTWKFAHCHFGKIWFWTGIVLLPLSFAAMVIKLNAPVETLSFQAAFVCGIQIVAASLSIIPTEVALRRTFDKNGQRKV